MASPTKVEDLDRRAAASRRFACDAALIALLAAVFAIFLLQPGAGTGPADVHVPAAAIRYVPPGSLRMAGGAIASLQWWTESFVGLVYVCVILFLLWALATRRKALLGKALIFSFIALGAWRPVNPATRPEPEMAVHAETARAMLGLSPHQPLSLAHAADPASRYLLAQIAFIEGDRASASRLSRGLEGGKLASPIEAPFRLQFLQGTGTSLSTACRRSGCFTDSIRRSMLAASAALALFALAAVGAFVGFARALRGRSARIGRLDADRRLRRALTA